MEIVNKVKAYLKLNDIQKAQKEKTERVKNILDLILKDKSPKEQIKTLERVEEQYNTYLIEYEKTSIASLETLKYKVTTDLGVIEEYFSAK